MKDALLIIDLQDEFIDMKLDSYQMFIAQVVTCIKQYKKLKKPILLVDYYDSGETVPEITKAIGTYERCYPILKDDEDGSWQIAHVVEKLKLNKLHISGVNGCACVLETVQGLRGRLEDLEMTSNKNLIHCSTCGKECYSELEQQLKAA